MSPSSSETPTESAAPAGFELAVGHDFGFCAALGPHYVAVIDGEAVLGFRVEVRHLNSMGYCHGAVIAGFADMQAVLVRPEIGIPDQAIPTINLTTDFIAVSPLGAWVEMRAALVRKTRSLVFCQGVITADGEIVARTNAIYKIGKPGSRGAGRDLASLPDLALI